MTLPIRCKTLDQIPNLRLLHYRDGDQVMVGDHYFNHIKLKNWVRRGDGSSISWRNKDNWGLSVMSLDEVDSPSKPTFWEHPFFDVRTAIQDVLVDLSPNYDSAPTPRVVLHDEVMFLLQKQPFNFFQKPTPHWLQELHGIGAICHYHKGLTHTIESLDPRDSKQPSKKYRCTQKEDGYGGRPFFIQIPNDPKGSIPENIDPITGFETVILRGPWHYSAPHPYHEVTYRTVADASKGMINWYFGFAIHQGLLDAAIQRFLPNWNYYQFFEIMCIPAGTPTTGNSENPYKDGATSEDMLFYDMKKAKTEFCHKNLIVPKVCWPKLPHATNPEFMGSLDIQTIKGLGVWDHSYELARELEDQLRKSQKGH